MLPVTDGEDDSVVFDLEMATGAGNDGLLAGDFVGPASDKVFDKPVHFKAFSLVVCVTITCKMVSAIKYLRGDLKPKK